MQLSLCNEVIREMQFPAQCDFARKLGYDGLELAPFTFSERPHLLSTTDRTSLRRTAEDAGIRITSLHWLLVTPKGLSITIADSSVRRQTVEVMCRLVELCAELGGRVLVHGSPGQRNVAEGIARQDASKWACEVFATAAEVALKAGVVYCLEPLSPNETNFVTSVAEAVEVVRAVNSPAFQTMIDCRAAALSEELSIPTLINRWVPTGMIRHFHVNDPNRQGPGQGSLDFGPILAALQDHNYANVVSVEPFDYVPDGPASAARAIGYLKGILAAQ
jgi:D-psicose/D-tagatose/L-ribulose 3-epimerase